MLVCSPLYTENHEEDWENDQQFLLSAEELHNTPSLKALDKKKDTFTINFNNIAIEEYIRFASKITNLNFIFNDEDMKFNITVVSEEPVTASNIVSILIQILRINGLLVLEQDGNLLITRVRNVSQLATVVSSDLPATFGRSPLVTRVFRINNANLDTVATIIKPMLSDTALLDVSSQTKQLIVTDLTTNVDKISTLLSTIDSPHSPFDVSTYVAKHVELQELIRIATQIVTPFSEGNPVLFVPQTDTGSIFIVSTPYLIEKSLSVLKDLDTGTSERTDVAFRGLIAFLYAPQNKGDKEFLSAVEDLAQQLSHQSASPRLIDCLKGARWIKESNSMLFLADEETLTKLKELLPMLDTAGSAARLASTSTLFLYRIKFADPEMLQNSLDQVAEDLQKAPQSDYRLIDALTSMKYLDDVYSLAFIADTETTSKLTNILAVFDVEPSNYELTQFLTYNPQNQPGEDLKVALSDLIHNLQSTGYADAKVVKSIETMQWIPANNALIFSGNPDTLARIQTLLTSLDQAGGQGLSTFYVYKLQNAIGSAVLDNLKRLSENLKDSHVANPALIQTLQEAKWIKENNSILLTGSTPVLTQAKALIEEFDSNAPSLVLGNKSAFLIYKPIHQLPEALVSTMKDIGKNLSSSGLIDSDLLTSIDAMRYVESTQSILFTGTNGSLEKIKVLLKQVDVISPQEAQVQQLGDYTFFIYKIQYVPAQQLIGALKGLTHDLQNNSAITAKEIDAINNLKWIKETNSLLFTGSPEALQKVEAILKKFDIPSLAPQSAGSAPSVSNFVVYTPRWVPGDELVKILEDFQHNLLSAGVTNRNLYETLSHLQWVPRTCSLIISGDPDSIARVEDLIKRFDTPPSEPSDNEASINVIQNTSFLIYKLQYQQGNEILTTLKQVATDLTPSTATGNQNLLNAINSLQWIRITNSLLASGKGDTLSKLRDLIQNLDVPLKQVFIEVLVIETDLSNNQNFGLQWGGKMKFLNKFAASSGNFAPQSNNPLIASGGQTATGGLIDAFQTGLKSAPPPVANNIPFGNGFDLGVIGDIIMHKGKSFLTLGSLVNAIQEDIDSTLILNPKIITQDNQTSTVFVGKNIPFIGSLVTTNSQIVQSSSNIEYRDIGFNLTVTPTIGNNDVVTLDITNDISDVINNTAIGQIGVSSGSSVNNNIQGITTSHTSMSTKVHVPNKHFVVLSGMIRETKSRFKSGIPCLGGLPVIGVLFSETDRIATKSNVIIFMRPHIINTYEEYKQITDHQEEVYKNSASLPVLKEEFDAAIDSVKTAEDE